MSQDVDLNVNCISWVQICLGAGAFVNIYWLTFLRINFLSKLALFLLILETISQDVMSHLKLKEASWQGGFQQCSDRNQPSNMKRVKNFKFQGWGVRVAGRGVYNARAYILTHMDEKKKVKCYQSASYILCIIRHSRRLIQRKLIKQKIW